MGVIRAGSFDRSISIMIRDETISPSGAVTATWASLVDLRARLVSISTIDVLRNSGGIAQATTIFETYWVDGITTANRVFYEGTMFAIKGIREIGRRRGLELTCEAPQ